MNPGVYAPPSVFSPPYLMLRLLFLFFVVRFRQSVSFMLQLLFFCCLLYIFAIALVAVSFFIRFTPLAHLIRLS